MSRTMRLHLTALAMVFILNSVSNAFGNDRDSNNLIGYIDIDGKVIIEPAFILANDFSEGLAGVVPKDSELAGIIDVNGRILVSPRFKAIGRFSQGLAPAADKLGRFGFINREGAFVIAPQFVAAFEFNEGLAEVEVTVDREKGVGKRGFIDLSGKFAVGPQFDSVGRFSEGRAIVMRDNRFNYVDKQGRLLLAEWVDSAAGDFADNRGPISTNEKWGFIDKEGNVAIPLRFDSATPFNNGHAMVALNKGKEHRIIDTTGRFSTSRTFSTSAHFHEGLTFLPEGCIDTQGRTVIKSEKLASIENHPEFHEGLAAVQIKGRYGYINKSGDLIIKPQPSFVQAGHFSSGRARIATGRNMLWIEAEVSKRKNSE